jgi:histone H3/H4
MSEALIVTSKVKKYIKDKAGMNTSASVVDALSSIIRNECDKAIASAQSDGRKTVMDRDFGVVTNPG